MNFVEIKGLNSFNLTVTNDYGKTTVFSLIKVKPPLFRFMESLHSTAILKKFEFLRPFSRSLRKLKKKHVLQ